jgi:shikimate dehydrogenase
MHNAAFGAAGIDGVYVPLPAADADDFVTFARAVGLRGASVTIPYKVALRPAAHEADKTVETIGALNTLRMDAGCWRARNTDVDGFLQPLRGRGVALAGRRVSILGAGGSARAVAVAAAGDGASVTVHARDRARAQVVAALVGGQTGPFPPDAGSWDVLVNCTPVGMHPRVDESPVPEDVLGGALVYDLIYNPRTTRLLRDAQAAGCQTIGGLDMLVGQAQAQFEWWTGVRPAFEVMHDAAQARLSEFNADEDHLV